MVIKLFASPAIPLVFVACRNSERDVMLSPTWSSDDPKPDVVGSFSSFSSFSESDVVRRAVVTLSLVDRLGFFEAM